MTGIMNRKLMKAEFICRNCGKSIECFTSSSIFLEEQRVERCSICHERTIFERVTDWEDVKDESKKEV